MCFGGDNIPYYSFCAEEWAEFRADTPLTLQCDEVRRMRSLGDPVDLDEVARIYLSLSRLLSCHVEASQTLFRQRQNFLKKCNGIKTPFIIGIAGSVAVGKSTTARILQELLRRWCSSPKVELITTDGFLYPNAILHSLNRMERKGFPDSYNIKKLLYFLSSIKAGLRNIKAPVYSHLSYDVQKNEYNVIDCPDILIIEGVNVLQIHNLPRDGRVFPFVSDFFDFSIYLDASIYNIHQWYIERFLRLRETAFQNPNSFFHRYANMDEKKAIDIAENLWKKINLKNLKENILPTRPRADLILRKGSNHLVEKVFLRKI